MVFYVYILKCWKFRSGYNSENPSYGNSFYCGYTKNIENRLQEHILGKNKSTKRWKGNIKLGYVEVFNSRREAMAREREIKLYSRRKKIKLILSELNSNK